MTASDRPRLRITGSNPRDDLLTLQVDGTKGSAVAGLRDCWTQRGETTSRALWNPDIEQPSKFFEGWQRVPDTASFDNAFKVQWELFLKHVVNNEPFRWTLLEGAKGVQLAEQGLASWKQRAWVDIDPKAEKRARLRKLISGPSVEYINAINLFSSDHSRQRTSVPMAV